MWARFLAEGLVIICSILIAFGIDAAWDLNKERAAERALLHALEIDMVQNAQEIDRVTANHVRTAASVDAFLTLESAEFPALAADALRNPGWIFDPTSFDPIDGTLRNDDLSILSDPDLRRALSDWTRQVANEQEGAQLNLTLNVELWTRASTLSPDIFVRGLAPELTRETIAALREDPSFVARVISVHRLRLMDVLLLEGLALQTDSVLALVRRVP